MFNTVLFDLDGTLTRSGIGIMSCARYVVEKMGAKGPDDWSVFVGPPLHDSFRNYCGMSDAEATQAVTLYRERYAVRGWEENEVYEGIPMLLRSLRKNGIHTGIVTSKLQSCSEKIAKRFGLLPYLDFVIGPGPEEKHPEKASMIRQAMQISPGPHVMIGDRRFDIEGARACGIPGIGVEYGYGSAQELTAAGASSTAASVSELDHLLLGDLPRARGLFLTMEGVDGCGKSTQHAALMEEMRRLGWTITTTREPGGDEIAEKIREIILDPANGAMYDETEAYLYAASRAQNVRSRILPALHQGGMVICDRFVDSSIAYQGGGRQLGLRRIHDLNLWAIEGCEPDLTIYLRMEPHEALARRRSSSELDRLEQEQDLFFERTYDTYEEYYRGDAGRRTLAVNAAQPIEDVTGEMLLGVRARLEGLRDRL